MSIENKLTYLEGTKTAIKDAIVAKGVAIDDNATFRSYATAISTIETGGGTEINNQTKTVEINQNGQTTVSYDNGYTGLESVVINTNVPTGSGDCNVGLCFDSLGYTSLPSILTNSQQKSIELKQQFDGNTNELSIENYPLLKEIIFLPMFGRENYSIKSIKGSSFIFFPPLKAKIHYWQYLFQDCKALQSIDLTNIEINNTSSIFFTSAFQDCSFLKEIIGLNSLNVENLTFNSFESAFKNCILIDKIDMSNFQYANITPNATGFNYMFNNCENLTSVKLPHLVNESAKNLDYMFQYCKKLNEIDMTGWNTSNVKSLRSTFESCLALDTIDLTGWNTSNLSSLEYCFSDCNSLTTIDLTGWDTSKVNSFYSFIKSCNNLKQIKGYLDIMSASDKFTSYYYMTGFSTQYNLRQMTFKNIGYASNATTFDMTYVASWGVNSDTITEARQSLIDSLITYSFDRATAGYSSCTLKLYYNTKAVLTEEEIAQITAKGYTIA